MYESLYVNEYFYSNIITLIETAKKYENLNAFSLIHSTIQKLYDWASPYHKPLVKSLLKTILFSILLDRSFMDGIFLEFDVRLPDLLEQAKINNKKYRGLSKWIGVDGRIIYFYESLSHISLIGPYKASELDLRLILSDAKLYSDSIKKFLAELPLSLLVPPKRQYYEQEKIIEDTYKSFDSLPEDEFHTVIESIDINLTERSSKMPNTNDLMNVALKLAGLPKMPVDTDIMVPGENIKKVLVGVDMETAEILLAKELGCDCVVSHHPKNTNADYADIMDHHIDKLVECGAPINKAQKVLKVKKDAVALNRHTANSERFASAARLLGMPYMCIHTPADLIGEAVVQKLLDDKLGKNPKATLKDVLDTMNELDEYKKSVIKTVIRAGDEKSYTGKIYVSMSGGTNGGMGVLKAYFEAGIGTIIQMHTVEEDIKAVKEQNIGNLVVAPHMASDSIGINRIIDQWEKMGVEVIAISGIVR